MNTTNDLTTGWLSTPCVHFGVVPPPAQAATLLSLLTADPDPNPVASTDVRLAASAFVSACGEVAVAVAHLLTLRSISSDHPDASGAPRPNDVDVLVLQIVGETISGLEQVALQDPLTGLGNRRALDTALTEAVGRAARSGRGLGVLYFDLVGLKARNDRLGHDAGDEALQAFGEALTIASRVGDSAFRVGGDEFVAILPDTDPEDLARLQARVAVAGAPPFSWGFAHTVHDGFDPDRLVRLADLRMLASRYRDTLHSSPQGHEVDLRGDADHALRRELS